MTTPAGIQSFYLRALLPFDLAGVRACYAIQKQSFGGDFWGWEEVIMKAVDANKKSIYAIAALALASGAAAFYQKSPVMLAVSIAAGFVTSFQVDSLFRTTLPFCHTDAAYVYMRNSQ